MTKPNTINPYTGNIINKRQLAIAMGVSPVQINKWFNEGSKILGENLLHLSDLLDITPEQTMKLLYGDAYIPFKNKKKERNLINIL